VLTWGQGLGGREGGGVAGHCKIPQRCRCHRHLLPVTLAARVPRQRFDLNHN